MTCQLPAITLSNDYRLRFLESEPDAPTGLRDRAMLSLGYDLLTRRAELVALRDGDVDACADDTYRLWIRRSKSDPFGAGRVAFCSPRSAGLLDKWRAWRSPNEWLSRPIYSDKPVNRILSDTTVKRLIRDAAGRCREPAIARAFSGHSMRVGAAQEPLKRGHDTTGIMRVAGWKTVNLLARYLEHANHKPLL